MAFIIVIIVIIIIVIVGRDSCSCSIVALSVLDDILNYTDTD
jgi:hypothetical protein